MPLQKIGHQIHGLAGTAAAFQRQPHEVGPQKARPRVGKPGAMGGAPQGQTVLVDAEEVTPGPRRAAAQDRKSLAGLGEFQALDTHFLTQGEVPAGNELDGRIFLGGTMIILPE
jgi:hypothetical protein